MTATLCRACGAKLDHRFCDLGLSPISNAFIKPGKEQSAIFECLGTKTGELPGWNFGKYVVSRDGTRAVFFASMTKPDDAKVIEAIEKMLAEAAPTKGAAKDATKTDDAKTDDAKASEGTKDQAPAAPKA